MNLTRTSAEVWPWVKETRFGKWFTTTQIWRDYVVDESVQRFANLLAATDLLDRVQGRELIDVGCGSGTEFAPVVAHLAPAQIVAFDIDPIQVALATSAAREVHVPVSVSEASVYQLPYANDSVDVVLTHQLFHHLSGQAAGLEELRRILKPGGILLLCESCEVFLKRWWVRWFFRHPEGVQKSAAQYLALIRSAGFSIPEGGFEASTPWWADDYFGLWHLLDRVDPDAEPGELYAVAVKPE